MTALRFAHPDDVVRYYERLHEGLRSVPGQCITVQVGTRCKLCSKGPWTVVGNGDPRPGRAKLRTVCASCGEVWDGEAIEVMRSRDGGANDHRRAAAARDDMIDHHMKLAPIVDDKPRGMPWSKWRWSRLVHRIYLDPLYNSYPRVVEWGSEKYPKLHWTESTVRGGIRTVRMVVEQRAIKAGVMQRVASVDAR